MRHALSYAAQQVSGLWSWTRDEDHVEKAFDFAGMGARNGVTAVTMVQAGFTGVWDVLDGEHNMILALSTRRKARGDGRRPRLAVLRLARPRSKCSRSAIRSRRRSTRCSRCGASTGCGPTTVTRIVVRLPEDGARIVDNSAMPDVNCQHLMAVALIDGTVSFEMSHSRERMEDPAVKAVRSRVQLVADKSLMDPAAPRSGLVEVTTAGRPDGAATSRSMRRARRRTRSTPPASTTRCGTSMAPVLGARQAEVVIDRVNALDDVRDVRELVALMTRRQLRDSSIA